jgi:hypothetical protein
MLFPVEDPRLRQTIIEDILDVHLHDNVQAKRLLADGSYERLGKPSDAVALDSQLWLLQHWKTRRDGHTSPAYTRHSRGEPGWPLLVPGSNGGSRSDGGEHY